MKTKNYMMLISLSVFIMGTGMVLAQNSQFQLQSKEANRYMNLYDSLAKSLQTKSGEIVMVKNQEIDSLIRVMNKKMENRLYLADSVVNQKKATVNAMIQKMENALNQLREQTQSRISNQNKEGELAFMNEDSAFRKQLFHLDSLIIRYAYMVANQYNENAIKQIQEKIQLKGKEIDSVIRLKTALCTQLMNKLDSALSSNQEMIKAMLMLKISTLDSVVGIKTNAKFKISEKYADKPVDTLQNKYKRSLDEVIDEIVIIDKLAIMVKFKAKISDPRLLKHLFKLEVQTGLKSTAGTSIEIAAIEWSDNKADVMKIVPAVAIDNPETIEIVYDGEVEMKTDETITMKEASETTGIARMNAFSAKIYPNPCTDYFTIQSSNAVSSVQIINLNGIVVKEFNSGITFYRMDDLMNGIYLVQIMDESGKITSGRIIKR